MKYYPVFLDVANKNCLVVGGGSVGTRKTATLVKCGAHVTVVSLVFDETLETAQGLDLVRRSYVKSDVRDKFLVFAATNDVKLNRQVLLDARQAGIPCNCADAPDLGDFILPAVMDRGDLICAVSTCGKSPALARQIRKELEAAYGSEYAVFSCLMGAIREKILSSGHDPKGHRRLFTKLMAGNLPALIASGDIRAIDAVLFECLGNGFEFASLVPEDSLPDDFLSPER